MVNILILVTLVVCANGNIVKRGFGDLFVGAISDVGSATLPEESMRAGCRSVGLYNREKNGGPPNRDASGGLRGRLAAGLAKIGNTAFSRSGMEQGCINAGFYDPKLDAQGRPLYQVGGGTTNIIQVLPAQPQHSGSGQQGQQTQLTFGGGQPQPIFLGGGQQQQGSLGGGQQHTIFLGGGQQQQGSLGGGQQQQTFTSSGGQQQPIFLGGGQQEQVTMGSGQQQATFFSGGQQSINAVRCSSKGVEIPCLAGPQRQG